MPDRRLRVMCVVFSLETGGLENVVVNLCKRLDPKFFAPVICVFRDGGRLERAVDTDRVELLSLRRLRNNDPPLQPTTALELGLE